MIKWMNAIICVVLLGCGCGLFYPEDTVEPPEDKTVDDYFNFSMLIDPGQGSFSSHAREDIFFEEMSYLGSDGRKYSRDDLFDRLDKIRAFYEVPDSISLQVLWNRSPDSEEPSVFNIGDTILVLRTYTVNIVQKTHIPGLITDSLAVIKSITGDSRFQFINHPFRNAWTILSWEDSPTELGLGFFHKNFADISYW